MSAKKDTMQGQASDKRYLPDLMTQEEVAAYLSVTPLTIRVWQRLHAFPVLHITRKVARYQKVEVDLWVQHRGDIYERRANA
jgi:hypothetical protein